MAETNPSATTSATSTPKPRSPPAPPPHPVHLALESRFPALAGQCVSPRARRVFAECPQEAFADVVEYAVTELAFDRLCALTGLDDRTALAALYSFARADGTVLSVRVRVPRDAPVLESVTGRFPCAANYERELVDLLGFEVRHLPPGKRYPLPDDWPLDQKPLRKDWKPTPPAPKPAVQDPRP